MLPVLSFWLIAQLFAVAALPLAWRLFASLPGRGYALAKPLGLLLVSYLFWLGSSLGFLGNTSGAILASLLLVAALSAFLGREGWQRDATGRRPLLGWLAASKALVIAVEALFLVALAGWAVVRSYSPDITTAGGEKFMELAFLNGILRSERFPPLDPWLSGFAISYYYFGYVMLSLFTTLSGLAPGVAFNVGLATWFALTVVAAFGVGYDMVGALAGSGREALAVRAPTTEFPEPAAGRCGPGPLAGGLLAALFVAVLGNLEGFLESVHSLGLGPVAFWRWLDIKDLNCLSGPNFLEPVANCPSPGGVLPERFFWWWRASRVLTDRDLAGNAVEVIDEFPFFSFLLGDMHPHVLALPFALLAIGLALALLLRAWPGQPDEAAAAVPPTLRGIAGLFPLGGAGLALYALGLGGLAFLNTWDFPIYLFLLALALGMAAAWRSGGLSWAAASRTLVVMAAVAGLGVLLYLPFYAGFQSQAGGILPNFIFPTRLAHFAVMFGPLLAAAIFLLIALSDEGRRTARRWLGFLSWTVLVPVAFLLAALVVGVATPGGQELVRRLRELPVVQEQAGMASLLELGGEVLRIRLSSPWAYLLLAGLIAWVLALLAARVAPRAGNAPAPAARPPASRSAPATFALLAVLTALLLVFSVEFVYLRDTFGVRMNTVFKFYYQAWVMLALVAAFAVVYLACYAGRVLAMAGLATVGLLVAAGLFYPVLSTYTRAERFAVPPTLDGTAYLSRLSPGDAGAVAWLQAQVPGVATVLEAPGGSYTYSGRISAQTGLPTLLGWEGHELQWRGNTEEQDRRRPDVETIYRSAQPAELADLLERWQIDYVVVGDLERQAYGITPQSEARFARAMDLVYDVDNTRIYRRRG